MSDLTPAQLIDHLRHEHGLCGWSEDPDVLVAEGWEDQDFDDWHQIDHQTHKDLRHDHGEFDGLNFFRGVLIGLFFAFIVVLVIIAAAKGPWT